MARILYVVTFILFSNQLINSKLHAQSNFQPGHIVTPFGEKINGEIDFGNWEKTPDKIKFKHPENPQQILVYSSQEIKGFAVGGEQYVSEKVEVFKFVSNEGKIERGSEFETTMESVFLQILVDGEKNLFHYKSPKSKDNFYFRNGEHFQLLKYKKYAIERTIEGKTRTVIVENKFFQGQLNAYLTDCPALESDFNNVQYKKESLRKLFLSYNECIGKKVEFQKQEKIKTEFGVLAGMTITNLNFIGKFHPNLTEVNYGLSILPTLGTSVDFILMRNRKKWKFTNELMIAGYSFSGQHINYKASNLELHSKTDFASLQVKVNNMLQYNLKYPSFDWFFNGGISNGLSIVSTNSEFLETFYFDTERSETRTAVPTRRRIETGFLIGTGIRKGNISGEIRYENGNGMSNYFSLLSLTHRLYLLVGYRF